MVYMCVAHFQVFFVIYLQDPSISPSSLMSTVDPDPVMVCDLMEGRDSFLTMARERNLEFSSLRRVKHSTMVMLYEVHREARKQSIRECIQSLVHACQCRDMTCKLQSCIKMKRVIRHTRDCRLRNNGNCSICKQFVALCLFHARDCDENQCSVPLCSNIKQKLKKQQIEHQIHENRLTMRRMIEMRAHSAAPTPSTHMAPSSAPSTPHRMQQKSPSTSPHSEFQVYGMWINLYTYRILQIV